MKKLTPQELRIGNLVNYKNIVVPVTMIGEYGIQSKTKDRTINAKFTSYDLEYIPLTEKWLIKFGFDRDNYNDNKPYYYTFRGFRLICNIGFLTLHNSNELVDFSPIELRFVHQLQNLYFALTGEELNII